MQTILITGGAGFIGSNFVRYLLKTENDVNIINLDALTYAGSMENLRTLPNPEKHTFIKGNICDRTLVDGLLRKYQVDTVIHFAAESHVDRSILGPGLFVQTNVVGTFTLLESVRQYWLIDRELNIETVHFHHISTDEVYGSLAPDEPPFSELTPYSPNSPYAASKAASDHLVRSYHHTYGLPVTITNCSNNYGPYQFPEKLIPLMITNALKGEPLPIYGDGNQIRDWLYVEDHCVAVWTVIKSGTSGETYNIGGNNQPTNLEIIRILCAILDERKPNSRFLPHNSLINFVADRPGHDRRYAMDFDKVNRYLGWRPRHTLEGGLLKTVKWYLAHTAWLDVIREEAGYHQWIDDNYQKRGEY